VRCIAFEGGAEIYVTAQCDAPEGYVVLPETDELCAAALAAYERGEAGRCPDAS
jgi:hypothetical protein